VVTHKCERQATTFICDSRLQSHCRPPSFQNKLREWFISVLEIGLPSDSEDIATCWDRKEYALLALVYIEGGMFVLGKRETKDMRLIHKQCKKK
jgi:hypothetical protein